VQGPNAEEEPCGEPSHVHEDEGAFLQVVQVIISGVSQGLIYGLIALGFVLIYKATETVNFAQGELMMLGAFLGLTVVTVGGPYWAALPVAFVGMWGIGMLLERVVLRPILGQPSFTVVMVTIGIGFIARGLVTMIPNWGTDTHTLNAPFRGEVIHLGGLVIGAEHLVVIAATLLLSGALFVFFRFSRVGVAMQAASQNQLAAYYMGIPVRRLNSLIWGLSAGVAAIAGVLLAPITFVHVNMGFIGLKAFPAAVIGGFGSLPGALLGGAIIGVVESLAGVYLPEGFKDIAAYVLLLVVLVVRPTGIFGETASKKV
jgi:branched-chain amino acid transport system permease protein